MALPSPSIWGESNDRSGVYCLQTMNDWEAVLQMAAIRVFLVDDHPIVREGIRRLLEMDERIEVVGEAEFGDEAVERVSTICPKVVLMDIVLPGLDGIEATRRLMAQNPDMRVVVLSSFGEHYLASAIEAGACGYILKSAMQPELVLAVLQAAGGGNPFSPSLGKVLFTRFAKMS